jgi:hypothetical protein
MQVWIKVAFPAFPPCCLHLHGRLPRRSHLCTNLHGFRTYKTKILVRKVCENGTNRTMNAIISFQFIKRWPHGLRRRSAAPSLAGIAGSNPAGSMYVCLLWMLCVVLLQVGWSLLEGSSNECVGSPIVIRCNNNPLHLHWVGVRGQTKKEIKKEGTFKKKI